MKKYCYFDCLWGGVCSLLLLVCALLPSQEALSQPEDLDPRVQMQQVYRAYSDLQKYLGRRELFVDNKQQKEITTLLKTLRDNFHKAESLSGEQFKNRGLAPTLTAVEDALSDISTRFTDGKKDYALWRLRSLSSYCIQCHTQFEIAHDFGAGNSTSLDGLNLYQRADYFFATRQFTKAAALYRQVIESDKFRFERIDALRRLMVIDTRVHPDPSAALRSLRDMQAEVALTPYEQEEINGWIVSLERWKQEQPFVSQDDQKIVAEAKRLLAEARRNHDDYSGQVSFIDLLRASALLHSVYDRLAKSPSYSQVLYLLGVIYSGMPHIFQSEIPGMFLEQCIRQFPGSSDAKNSFRVYLEKVREDYTGSAGTRMPAEVQLEVEELREIAFGTKVPTRG